jgi:hypothetical protein
MFFPLFLEQMSADELSNAQKVIARAAETDADAEALRRSVALTEATRLLLQHNASTPETVSNIRTINGKLVRLLQCTTSAQ